MFRVVFLLTLAALAAVPCLASYGANLNYRSPSNNHPALGISVPEVGKQNDSLPSHDPPTLNFTHGVASGDPYASSVILWTRCAPTLDDVDDNSTVSGDVPVFNPVPIYGHSDTNQGKPPSRSPVCLNFAVARDKELSDVVDSGTVYTSPDVDYTVKVEAAGLDAFTHYYYRFSVCNSELSSPTGRTKTTPAPKDDVSSISLAIYSCSNFPFGFFNAYGNTVRKDSVDYVVHLGDYLYEYKSGDTGYGFDYGWGYSIDRVPLPDRNIFTLYDYRKRYATYRTDEDLLSSHQMFPWIPVWDDHEVADNAYRDGYADMDNTEDAFIQAGGVSTDQRKMNAVRAYFEWLPIRQVDMDDNLRVWRSFQIGTLIDLFILDTRNYDRSITDLYWNKDYIGKIANDAGRSMMGPRQEKWFLDGLVKSANRGTTWRIIGSQTVFSRINSSAVLGNLDPFNYDQWDGYLANRNRTLRTLYENNINNNIMISGDSHANWVSDLVWLDSPQTPTPYSPKTGSGSVGVEFGGTAISSPSPYGENVTLSSANDISRSLVADNPELQWSEAYYRGYYELHVSHQAVDARFFGTPDIRTRNPNEIAIANFSVLDGGNRLRRVEVEDDGWGAGQGAGQDSRNRYQHRIGDSGPDTVDVAVAVGGTVESGALKVGMGQVVQTNVTYDTDTGRYFVGGQ